MFVGRTIGAIGAALLASVLLAAAATAAPAAKSGAAVAQVTRVASLELDVLAQLNQVRREHGLAPLKLSAPLGKAAAAHSVAMARTGFFAHESSDGSSFWKRVERFYGPKGWKYWAVGENLLWSSPNVDGAGALKLWMESPKHRANILTPKWREIGISAVHAVEAPGTFNGLEVTIVTTDFGVRR